METIEGNGVVTGEEKGNLPDTVIESSGTEPRISGSEGEDGVVKEGSAASEIGKIGGVEETGPAAANQRE
ncbi:hypothetical protein L6164_031332 [Bauhinia variegata]|uniref:Uncharacterized protein n=1 Tax=Bauhinia variegata TaxID=167791 RepID=A0ACB9LFA9_BAUVA|nr:hypothetical protein L6164_031332 [Bauhinia variegata]